MIIKKSDSLKYHANLTQETIDKQRLVRKQYIELAKTIEELGNTRETNLAFTKLEESLHYAIKHLCLVDSQATLEEV